MTVYVLIWGETGDSEREVELFLTPEKLKERVKDLLSGPGARAAIASFERWDGSAVFPVSFACRGVFFEAYRDEAC